MQFFSNVNIIFIDMYVSCKTNILAAFLFVTCNIAISAQNIIEIKPQHGSDNKNIVEALNKASKLKNKPVTIRFLPGIYDFTRSETIKKIYYVSNTTSEKENPNPIKHIAIYLKDLKNVTLDGCGSTLLMNGSMSSFVLDNCENISIKNFSIDNSNPTQTELTVKENGNNYLIAKVHQQSKYKIENEKLTWYGDGWSFNKGIAQAYDYSKDITWRSWSPMTNLKKVVELEPGLLYMKYIKKPTIKEGTVFQMRDGIRNEVCGFIYNSDNIIIENTNFYYVGNFGIVCQYSKNISFNHCDFSPKPGSGRTNSGFADFIQVSGCKDKINIRNCIFSGAHDDAINIHGTHLKIVEYLGNRSIKVRFMHHQTYGFNAFQKGDIIEIVNAETLLKLMSCKVVSSEMNTKREIILRLDKDIPLNVKNTKDIVIENITWTPQVCISGNKFSRIPTRGILLSTRQKSVIENNIFYGTKMSAIYIANDAKSWYESGPVYNLTIRRNKFIECGSPIIKISPEYTKYNGAIHKNITIEENFFESNQPDITSIYVKGTDNIKIINNFFNSKNSNNIIMENVSNHRIINNNQP